MQRVPLGTPSEVIRVAANSKSDKSADGILDTRHQLLRIFIQLEPVVSRYRETIPSRVKLVDIRFARFAATHNPLPIYLSR